MSNASFRNTLNTSARLCEVCGGVSFTPLPNRRQVPLSRCQECGLWRCTTIPSPDDLAKIYTRDYYQSWGLETHWASVERMKRQTFGRLLETVARFHSAKGSLLDIGCAVGFLMAEAQAQGWTPYGLELAEFAVRKAQDRFGDHVVRGVLESSPFPGVQFDAVTMVDLLEHVTHPRDILQACHARLKPGGMLAIGTPNTESLTAKLCGGSWEQIKQEHLYYFSPANLRRLLKETGFELLEQNPLQKSLNLHYLADQFTVYPLPIVTPLVRLWDAILPESVRQKNVWFTIGEMLVIARRT